MERKRQINPWLTSFLLVMLCLSMAMNLAVPDREVSYTENRPLIQREEGKDPVAWFQDQIYGRSLFFHINYLTRKALGQKLLNGVYLCHDRLIGKPEETMEKTMQENVEAVDKLAVDTGLPVWCCVVNPAAYIQQNFLPAFAPAGEGIVQLELANAEAIPLAPTLDKQKEEYIYYRTDHHWTSLGAEAGFETISRDMDIPFQAGDFEPMLVSTTFQGTLASKSGSVGIADDIYIYGTKEDLDYVVTWADGSRTASIYNRNALKQKDQYELFLGKNQALVTIDVSHKLSKDRNLLLLKDSYANCMVQFLLPYYDRITIVDPRYYYDNLQSLIHTSGTTEILCLFSRDTFVTDRSLASVINS